MYGKFKWVYVTRSTNTIEYSLHSKGVPKGAPFLWTVKTDTTGPTPCNPQHGNVLLIDGLTTNGC